MSENQRKRLLGAMVASVATRGFAATRVADLTELSGVSSKSFYALFSDRDACLLATVKAVLAEFLAEPEEVADESWIERAEGIARIFGERVAAQPAAARLWLIEAHAGNAEVLELLDETTIELERRALRLVRSTPAGKDAPRELVSAGVGALLEVTRLRLRRGTEAELPEVAPALVGLLARSCPPPPQPLRLNTRRQGSGSEPIAAPDHAERILHALTTVAAEAGYANTTIDQIVKKAGISASMFYAHFSSKEDALLGAIDSGGAQIVAGVLPPFRRGSDWPQAVRSAIGALFNLLASRPALAQLMMVEVYAAGPAALERRDQALRPIEGLWTEARRRGPGNPAVLFEAFSGAIYHLAYQRIRTSGPAALPALAPACSYFLLAPFVGAAAAAAAANGEAAPPSSRAPDPEAVRAAATGPIRFEVMRILTRRAATVEELVDELGRPEDEVQGFLDLLDRAGFLERTEGGEPGNDLYRSPMGEIFRDEWSRLDHDERGAISRQIIEVIEIEIERSLESGSFDNRADRALIRSPLQLDEQGFRELSELSVESMARGMEIEVRSRERMQRTGENPIEARHVQMLFEMPPGRGGRHRPGG